MLTFMIVKSQTKPETDSLMHILDDNKVRYVVHPQEIVAGKYLADGITLYRVPALILFETEPNKKLFRVFYDKANWASAVALAVEYNKRKQCYEQAVGAQTRLRWRRDYEKTLKSLLNMEDTAQQYIAQVQSRDANPDEDDELDMDYENYLAFAGERL